MPETPEEKAERMRKLAKMRWATGRYRKEPKEYASPAHTTPPPQKKTNGEAHPHQGAPSPQAAIFGGAKKRGEQVVSHLYKLAFWTQAVKRGAHWNLTNAEAESLARSLLDLMEQILPKKMLTGLMEKMSGADAIAHFATAHIIVIAGRVAHDKLIRTSSAHGSDPADRGGARPAPGRDSGAAPGAVPPAHPDAASGPVATDPMAAYDRAIGEMLDVAPDDGAGGGRVQ